MKDLLFLPIEIKISTDNFRINKPAISTFNGLWQTKHLSQDEINSYGVDYITNQLPLDKITVAKFNTQPEFIPAHIDVIPEWTKTEEEYLHIKNNEPAGYRVVLIGKNDSLEVFDGKEWQQALLPTVPFAYVLNSTTCRHRVIKDTGRQTLYFRGFLNKEKHRQMLEKNLKKFKDYAIFSEGI